MKQVFLRGGRGVVEDVPAPVVGDNSVLVQVAYSCVSAGTEGASLKNSGKSLIRRAIEQPENVKRVVDSVKRAGISSTLGRVRGQLKKGVASGYSAAGTVIEVGKNVSRFKVGDRVACAGSGIAFHAEFIDVPSNLVAPVPDGLDLKLASTVTLGAIAMQGVRRANPTLGETFLVVGLGTLGLIIVQLLKAAGCRVIGMDIDANRLAAGKQYGVDLCVDPTKGEDETEIDKFTEGHGVDGVIIAASTPSSEVVNAAMRMSRRKGRVVIVGDVGMDLKRGDMYQKELDFLISTSYGPGRYDPMYEEKGIDYPIGYVRWTENRNMGEFLRLLDEGKVAFSDVEAETFALDQADEAFASLTRDERRPSLVFLSYPENQKMPHRIVALEPAAATSNASVKPALGIVGASSFFEGVHLSNIQSLAAQASVSAVASRTGHNAKGIAERLGAAYCTTDYRELLADESVNTIFICTRHNLHAHMVLSALQANKHVFVEKPLALDPGELESIKAFYVANSGAGTPIFMVGYNRRFSPAAEKLKARIGERTTPLQINYVMNAGALPVGHWVNDEDGGGRNMGEACHIYDLFNFLVGPEVGIASVQAQSVNAGERFLRSENFTACISYEDGSVCNLVYTALGGSCYPKETMTVFVDGQTYQMNNYSELVHFGQGQNIWQSRYPQKGHLEELRAFFAGLERGGQWPIGYEEQLKASEISFLVEQQIV